MKAIVNRLRYDTEKARSIGCYDNLGRSGVQSTTDFSYYWAELYVTNKGNYFLAASGNCRSPYQGDVITPMSREEAFEWASEYLSAELTEVAFSDMFEDA